VAETDTGTRFYRYTGEPSVDALGLRLKTGDVQELPVALVEPNGQMNPDFSVVTGDAATPAPESPHDDASVPTAAPTPVAQAPVAQATVDTPDATAPAIPAPAVPSAPPAPEPTPAPTI